MDQSAGLSFLIYNYSSFKQKAVTCIDFYGLDFSAFGMYEERQLVQHVQNYLRNKKKLIYSK